MFHIRQSVYLVMIEFLRKLATLFGFLRWHQETVTSSGTDVELAELVLQHHPAERLGGLDAPIPCQVSVPVVERFAVFRHRIGEEIQQSEPHLLWALVELTSEENVTFSPTVLDVVEFKVIELQFSGGHTFLQRLQPYHAGKEQSDYSGTSIHFRWSVASSDNE